MGAVLGALACLLTQVREKTVIIETVAVAIFGAYIGGDFVAAMLSHGTTNDKDFSAGSLGLAVLGAVVFLLLAQADAQGGWPAIHAKRATPARLSRFA